MTLILDVSLDDTIDAPIEEGVLKSASTCKTTSKNTIVGVCAFCALPLKGKPRKYCNAECLKDAQQLEQQNNYL
jgi:hypothetical protein